MSDLITQQSREVAINTPLGEDALLIQSMSGSEQMGRLFSYNVSLLSEKEEIKIDDIIGQNVTIRLEVSEDVTRYFNGCVSRFVELPTADNKSHYQATIVPWMWFLTKSADCRIFQEMNVPDIIQKVFNDRGFSDFKLNLHETYRSWDYCVQYRETDFNFVSRLMEHEGIYYYFEHEDGKHTCVLSDAPNSHEPCSGFETIKYRSTEEKVENIDSIGEWIIEKQVNSGSYVHRDFDFEKPKGTPESRLDSPKSHSGADFEIFDYPGVYVETSDGDQLAKVRLNELQVDHEIFRGKSLIRNIVLGGKFTLEEHPKSDQNRGYVVASMQHQITSALAVAESRSGEPVYKCSFSVVPDDVTYKSQRTTPRPQIVGPQTAFVTGPSGDDKIYTDKHGRIKVQFHWDRDGEFNENSSCWIRVSQGSAGKGWGAFTLPRIGQEVIVEFLEGDPDRPIVTGRIYNGENKPPYPLPDNKTISTTKSSSNPGGAGFNEIRFEDKQDEEQIFIHGQKNQDIRILNDVFEWVGNDTHLVVVNDQKEDVQNNRSETVAADHMEKIGKDRHLKVAGKEAKGVDGSLSLTVKGDVAEVFKGNHSEATTGDYFVKAKGIVLEASMGITLKCGGNSVVINSSGVTVKGSIVTIDGGMTKINSGPGAPPTPGKAGTAVAPTDPEDPEEADKADPGKVAEIKAKQKMERTGKYSGISAAPFKLEEDDPEEDKDDEEKKSWIEIELKDEEDNPIPGEKYEIEIPDGRKAKGTLDENGYARVEGFEEGECKVTFPNLDKDAWEKE